jgi:cytochrome c2
MHPDMNSLIALAYLIFGAMAVAVMLELKGKPKDRAHTRTLVLVHRLLGYLFVAIFVFMLVSMVKKIGSYQDEVNTRTVIHIVLAVALVPLLVLKIAIVRRYRILTNRLLALGVIIFVLSLGLNALTAGYYYLHRTDVRYTSIMAVDADILDDNTGRHFVFKRCGKCHSYERVFRSFKSEKGWSQTVNLMARIDAPNIRPFEIKQIINYLVNQQKRLKNDQADQVTEEIGKTLLKQKCTLCHDLERVIRASKTETEWTATVERMVINMGDLEFLSPVDKKTLVKYLSKTG